MKAAVWMGILVVAGGSVRAQHIRMRPDARDSVHIAPRPGLNAITHSDAVKTVLPPDHYIHGLGFFCREEIKFQKAHVPVIFRVGSVDDCNRLEQKPGYK